MSGEDLAFGYRKSAFMGTKRIITSAELRLESGAEAEITAKMEDFMRRRREKQPLELPSAAAYSSARRAILPVRSLNSAA